MATRCLAGSASRIPGRAERSVTRHNRITRLVSCRKTDSRAAYGGRKTEYRRRKIRNQKPVIRTQYMKKELLGATKSPVRAQAPVREVPVAANATDVLWGTAPTATPDDATGRVLR